MSLRKRLMLGIALLLSVLWLAAIGWFLADVRGELREVLDARLASSAHMVQGLLARGDLQVDRERFEESIDGREPLPSLPTQVSCQLWTLDGEVLTFSDEAPPLADEPESDGFSTQTVEGELWRVYTLTDHDNGIRIATAERQSLRTVLVRDVAFAVSLPFLLALPGMALLIWVGVGRGLKPLIDLRDSIQTRHANALAPLPQQAVPSEVAPLVQALNGLFVRLNETMERERRFTGDAAHELRTPLAGIKTQLQIAKASEGDTRDHALAQAVTGVDRMSRLVGQLLTLARVDGAEGEEAFSDITAESLPSVLQEVIDELQAEARKAGVTFQLSGVTQGMPPELRIGMPPAMLHTAMRNLLDNAIHHSPQNGRIRVTVEETDEGISLTVRDEGSGLDEAQLARVTRRFYRAGGAGQGSGLGLSIVEAICDQYGARFSLHNTSSGHGLVAAIILPIELSESSEVNKLK